MPPRKLLLTVCRQSLPQQPKRAPPAAGRSHTPNDATANGRASGPHSHGPRPNPHYSSSGPAAHAGDSRGINGNWRSVPNHSSKAAASTGPQPAMPLKQQQHHAQTKRQPEATSSQSQQPQQAREQTQVAPAQHLSQQQEQFTPSSSPKDSSEASSQAPSSSLPKQQVPEQMPEQKQAAAASSVAAPALPAADVAPIKEDSLAKPAAPQPGPASVSPAVPSQADADEVLLHLHVLLSQACWPSIVLKILLANHV